MPSFKNVEVTTTVDIDFEVYCSCGAHLCNESEGRLSRSRGCPQVVVNACKACIDNATAPLLEQIANLEYELEQAKP
jgi:hypothetical protein